jgi:hypothetical protein
VRRSSATPSDCASASTLWGYTATVTAVDAIDATDGSGLTPGQLVTVVSAPDDPHGARLDGQARTHYWRTTLGVYTGFAVYLAAVNMLLLVIGRTGRQLSARKAATHPRGHTLWTNATASGWCACSNASSWVGWCRPRRSG